MEVSTIEAALDAIRRGEFAIVVDDFDRENEGDFIASAHTVTHTHVAKMLAHTTGVICTPMPAARAEALGLPLMVPHNKDPYKTAFTVTVDYRIGTSTGISATDRAATIRALARDDALPDDFTRPGHVFPLIAREGGVMVRGGHTEAGVDLCRLAGLPPVAYLCELCDHESFEMLRMPQLVELARKLRLPLISIADLQRYMYRRQSIVRFQGFGSSLHGASAEALSMPSRKLRRVKLLQSERRAAAECEQTGELVFVETAYTFSSIHHENRYTVLHLRAAAPGTGAELGDDATEADGVESVASSGITTRSTDAADTTGQSTPVVYVHVDDVQPLATSDGAQAWERAMSSAASMGVEALTARSDSTNDMIFVHVSGDITQNVHGKASAVLDSEARAASEKAPISAPPSAYDHLYPSPAVASRYAASAKQSAGATFCDRVSAEIAQAVSAVCAHARDPLPTAGVHINPALHDASCGRVSEDALVESARHAKQWPRVQLLASDAQPLPSIWAFGIEAESVTVVSISLD